MKCNEKQVLKQYLNLIYTVERNYNHIVELEALIDLLKLAKPNDYWETHFPFILEVAKQTRSSHYCYKEEIDNKCPLRVSNVLPKLMSIYGEFSDDVEFDVLNEFNELNKL